MNELKKLNYQNGLQYDSAAKQVLSDKNILAILLKDLVAECHDMTIEEIISCLENNLTETDSAHQLLSWNTEIADPDESKVFFDLLFSLKIPDTNVIRILINLEAQKDFHPGYDLVQRGILYCAKGLTLQPGKLFSSSDNQYGSLCKFYSIWVCFSTPMVYTNSIVSYHLVEDRKLGNPPSSTNYDLMELVLICLGTKYDQETGVIRLLDILFSPDMSTEERNRLLQKEYQFTLNTNTEWSIKHMSNLWEGIVEHTAYRVTQEVTQKVTQEVSEEINMKVLRNMASSGESVETIAKYLELPVAEVRQRINELKLNNH